MREKQMVQILKLMNQNPVFSVLSDSKKELVYKDSISQYYKKGETIVFEGDYWPYLFLLVKGSVNAFKSSIEGRSLVVTTFFKGSIFWGLAFFFEDLAMP